MTRDHVDGEQRSVVDINVDQTLRARVTRVKQGKRKEVAMD